MTTLEKVLYTGKTHTTGGRDGASRSSDDRLNIKLSSPGGPGTGTNPEQLFAAGWSACFIGAMGKAAGSELWRKTADEQPVKISGDVSAFQPAGPRWVYVLIKAGGLWVGEGPGKPRAFVDSDLLSEAGAAAFQAIDAQTVYVLGADRKLWAEKMPPLQP